MRKTFGTIMLGLFLVSAVTVGCKGKKEEKKEEPAPAVVTPPPANDTPATTIDTTQPAPQKPVKPGE